jgi:hypothetical protein
MMKTPTRIAMVAALAAAFLAAGGKDRSGATTGPGAAGMPANVPAAEVTTTAAVGPAAHAYLAGNLPGWVLSLDR